VSRKESAIRYLVAVFSLFRSSPSHREISHGDEDVRLGRPFTRFFALRDDVARERNHLSVPSSSLPSESDRIVTARSEGRDAALYAKSAGRRGDYINPFRYSHLGLGESRPTKSRRKEEERKKNGGKLPWKISVLRPGTRNGTGIAKEG